MGKRDRGKLARREFLDRARILAGAAAIGTFGGSRRARAASPTEIVFASAPFFTAASINELIASYNGSQQAVRVSYVELQSAADGQALHRQLAAALKGTGKDPVPDVFSLDLVRIAEFADAGLSLPLGDHFGTADLKGYFPGVVEACSVNGKLVAMPWFVDSGMLFYRKDILQRIGSDAPQTWDELAALAGKAMGKDVPFGYLWQGKRSEALVCNLVSAIGSNGGRILDADGATVRIAEPEAVAAVQFLYDTIRKTRISPAAVLDWDEEPSRHPFNDGKALFLRNWSYTWGLAQQQGSAIAGKIGVARLPHFPNGSSAACLGGFQYAINARTKHREAAFDFLRWLTRPQTQLRFATVDGLAPTRESVFADPALAKSQPFLAQLKDVFAGAIPRPITRKYPMVSAAIQSEVHRGLTSGDIAGALSSAKSRIEAIISA